MRRCLAPLEALLLALLFSTAAAAQAPEQWSREFPRTDFSQSLVEFDEIMSGGPPRDGIPSIDDPVFVDVETAAAFHEGREPVLSVEIEGEARAYPLRVLMWHEIVNDTLAGRPIAVTYCPLCNTGAVFDRRIDGETTTFGATGRLLNSNLVMYDRATESWWRQFDGLAIVGARAGDELERLPVQHESFADFAARRPQGEVLVPSDSGLRAYGRNPYAGYDSAIRPFLYRGDYEGPGEPLMRVVSVPGREEAWSFDLLRKEGEIRAGDLRILWRPGVASALDAATIAAGRDVGSVTVERIGPDGRAEPVPYDVPFAFAFRAFHPDAPIHHPGG